MIQIKTATGLVDIPDTITSGGVATFQVKTGPTTTVPLRELFVKDSDTGPLTKIWPLAPVVPTQDPTQPPCTDCGTGPCGDCLQGSIVYYPIYNNLGSPPSRWDCGVWNQTGKPENIFSPIPNASLQSPYYKVYDLVDGYNILPPPPGYILGEFTTFSVKDHVVIYYKRFTETKNDWGFCGLPIRQITFAQYKRDLSSVGTHIDDSCIDICVDNPCFVDDDNPGASPTTCTGNGIDFNTFISQVNPLLNTTCIATNDECTDNGSCYTSPGLAGDYHCRDVQSILPPMLWDQAFITEAFPALIQDDFSAPCVNQFPSPAPPKIPEFAVNIERYYGIVNNKQDEKNQNGPFKYKDITTLLWGGCDGGTGTAWLMRAFLPFYVSLPDNVKGKYVVFEPDTTGELYNASDYNPDFPNTYGNNPILKQAYDICINRIFASSSVYLKDPADSSLYWGIFGWPKEGTHTHVLMIEFQSSNDCDACLNNGYSVANPRIFRFYPITDSEGNFVDKFNEYLKNGINLPNGSYKGIQDLQQLTDVAYSNCLSDPDFNQVTVGHFYRDTPSDCTVNPNKITYQKFLNAYYQSTFTITDTDRDCNCIAGIAGLIAGGGVSGSISDAKEITLTLDENIENSFVSLIDTIDGVKDTITNTYSNGALGGEW